MYERVQAQTVASQAAGGAQYRAHSPFVIAMTVLCLAAMGFGFVLGMGTTPAFAAGQSTQNQGLVSESVDPDATGSITLTLRSTNGTSVSGGRMAVYQVGQLTSDDGGYRYEYTDAFSSAQTALTKDAIENADTDYIDQLAQIAHGTQARSTQTVGTDGAVTFDNLPVGVYLVVQTKAASGYESTNPFLVTIPFEGSYDVNATPKVGPVSPRSSSSTSKSTSSSTSESSSSTSTSAVPGNGGGGTGGNGSTPATLPQTGQLWWPTWLLSIAGVALIVVGLARNRRGEVRHGA